MAPSSGGGGRGDRSILTSFWVEYVVQETPERVAAGGSARPDRDGEVSGNPRTGSQ